MEFVMNVLIATDGSEAAVEAAHKAVELLRPGARVALAMVVPSKQDPMLDAGGFEGPVMTDEEAEQEWQENKGGAEAELDKEAALADQPVETKVVADDGGPGPGIVRVAKELPADVIVIGSSGKGALRRFFTGSVSDHVVHHAPCPVLVIRHDDD